MIWRLLLIMVLFSSCKYNAFVKRRYTKGYFVSAHGKALETKANLTNKGALNTSEKTDVVFVKPIVSNVTSAIQLNEEKEKIYLKTTVASKNKTELSAHPVFTPLNIVPVPKKFNKKNTDGFQRGGNGILYGGGFILLTLLYALVLLSRNTGSISLIGLILFAALLALITLATGVYFF